MHGVTRERAVQPFRSRGSHLQETVIQDPQSEARQCLKFAGMVFGQEDMKRLPNNIATAFARAGSRLRALAGKVLNLGLLPPDTLVGLSTIGQEVKAFGTMRMGF